MKTLVPGESKTANVKLSLDGGGSALRIALAGRLDAASLPEIWRASVPPARDAGARGAVIDGSALEYCDGAGLGLFAEIRRVVISAGGAVEFEGFTPDLQRLVSLSFLNDPLAAGLKPAKKPGFVTTVGASVRAVGSDVGEIITFIGSLTAALALALLRPLKVRWGDARRVAAKAGADAVPVVSLLGLLVGLILAFQAATPLRRLGAEPLIPTIVAVSVVRELGPLITAVILAGRSGSAFAAEIGTMTVTEEVSALKTMGLEPTPFLVVPRVLAAIFITPLLTIFNIVMSIVGGGIVMLSLGYSRQFYMTSITEAVKLGDLIGGVSKGLVFGLIVAGIGCLRGVQTRSGPGAVGESTTRAVVAGIVLTIIADAVIGVVYFYLGI